MKKAPVILLVSTLLGAQVVSAQGFDEYRDKVVSGFGNYREQTVSQFDAYRAKVNAQFSE